MAKKLRVYEIGKELGLSNKEALDLCIALGIDVKSHSSSVEDAHADRVRRRAQREHLGIYGGGGEAGAPAPALAPEKPEAEAPREEKSAVAPPRPEVAKEASLDQPEAKKPDLAAVIAEEAAKREEAERVAIANAAKSTRPEVPEGVAQRRPAPVSPSGQPVPPPPRRAPMTSLSGRPIPPPPKPQTQVRLRLVKRPRALERPRSLAIWCRIKGLRPLIS